MSPGLRPLRLPLLVERRRKQEEEAAAIAVMTGYEKFDGDVSSTYNHHYNRQYPTRQHSLTATESISSEMTSPVTPTFSARGHLRYSSSVSSFDLALHASCEDLPSSPIQSLQTPSKRILDDVEEEPFEYDRFNHLVKNVHAAYDDISEHLDLYDCLCDEPCIHRDADMMRTTSNFYSRGREIESDFGCFSDGDSPTGRRSSRTKQRNGSLPPFTGLSNRIGSRFPSFARWRSPRKSSAVSSPVLDMGSERRSMSRAASRAASSRSSSLSRTNRHLPDRSNEPPLPPTPALSFFESSDSITLPGPLDVEEADSVLSSIQRDRKQATTPLLPPMMTSSLTDYAASQPSPLQSPTVASPLDYEPQSPLILSPPLSTKPSISSFRQIMICTDVPPIPDQDAWSDRLGHANFTISPVPYKPSTATLSSLRELRGDWEMARVNYTKHLVRTGEHYGMTSKTYVFTEEKWAEIDRTWRAFHDEVLDAVVANGEALGCDRFDESIITVPIMDGEGKFPERGDEDIVGPMTREATMSSPTGTERRRPSFWRKLTDRVGL
ncbi:hypothetical protein FHL15_009258 [Xylaria flabelliformis]|uniref:Only prolin and serin are matching in the corresponding protein n=1 Tax=Xylaria flabelliformis TaxID=2512241 RepID=A0A553HPE4_9PEZI|nr:hypothetical protein FHL15_009258 [Xylaria flabelliformis]